MNEYIFKGLAEWVWHTKTKNKIKQEMRSFMVLSSSLGARANAVNGAISDTLALLAAYFPVYFKSDHLIPVFLFFGL